MPIIDDPYTDPEAIQAVYENADEVLLAEIALATGNIPNVVQSALAFGGSGASGASVASSESSVVAVRQRFKVDPNDFEI